MTRIPHSPSRRKKFLLVAMAALVIPIAFGAYLFFSRPNLTAPAAAVSRPLGQAQVTPKDSGIGPPVRILIPKIKVDTVLEYVSIRPDGVMNQPSGPSNAAWLNRRPLPGEVGTSVIAGHFGYKNNKPAVFDDLYQLRTGDKLYIKDTKGAEITFVVQELKTYSPDQEAAEVFDANDGKSHLNLITCQGNWNESLKSYDTRLVVFANKE